MAGNDIFISYSREDRSAARHFAECFGRAGFAVWWDAALRSGETFDEVIEKELRGAKAVVVLWSPRSVASRWVRAEATLADRFNKLVPVIIESCNLPIIFELTHAANLADWTGNETDPRYETLIDDLRRLVGVEKKDVPAEDVAKLPAEPAAAPAVKEVAAPEPLKAAADPAPAATPELPRETWKSSAEDELMAALERLSQARKSKLAKPTTEEVERTEFFARSDEYRASEGDKVHCLQRLDGDEQVTSFLVTPNGLSIGRTAPADVIVPGTAVSRSHCRVEISGDKLKVTDLNSTNGTFIDDKRVERSAHLPVGSILRVGNVSFEHEVRDRSDLEGVELGGLDEPMVTPEQAGRRLILIGRSPVLSIILPVTIACGGRRYRPWSGWPW